MYVIKNTFGVYFVENKGFTASTKAQATTFPDWNAAYAKCGCANSMGVKTTIEPMDKSYSVLYIRKGAKWDGSKLSLPTPDAGKGQFDPSKRRFATFKEACIHASRFYLRKANAGDPEGTAGHRGVVVVETNDPVNAYVNPETGLTNSL